MIDGITDLVGIAAIAVVLLAVALAVAFDKGWLWLSQERIDKLQVKVDALQEKLAARLAKKAPKAAAPKKSKAERIAEANALLAGGSITQAVYDKAVEQIMAE